MKKIIYSALALSTLLLAGCYNRQAAEESKAGMNTPTAPKTVKIGVIAPLSGPAATYGEDATHAFTMAQNNFNATHKDYQISLIFEDGKCEGKSATEAAQKLVQIDQVKAIFGGVCSSETLAASKITQPAGVVLLSSTASSPEISKAGDHTYRFRSDLVQGDALSKKLQQDNVKNFSLIYEATDYAIGLANVIKANMPGSTIIEEKFVTEEKDHSTIAKKIAEKADSLDGIVYIANNESSVMSLITAFEREGLLAKFKNKIYTSEVGVPNNVLAQMGTKLDGILSTQLADYTSMGNEANSFVDAYKKNFKVNLAEVYLVLYNEAFNIISQGITDPRYGEGKLNEYMKSINQQSPRTALGHNFYFDGSDAVGLLNFVIKKAEGGKLVSAE